VFHNACYSEAYDSVLYLGAFGAGKSLALVQQFADMAAQYPNTRYLLVRKRYADLKDTTLITFKESVDPRLYDFHKTDHNANFHNGSVIMFRGLDKMTKLGSVEVAAVGVDELYELTFDDFKMLKGRARQKGTPPEIAKKIIAASNPSDIGEWMHKYFESEKEKGRFYVKANSLENPHLPKGYVENLVRDYPPSWIRRFIYGEWGSVPKGEAVFQGFMRTMHGQPWHVDEKLVPIKGVPLLRGWDFGWHHPANAFCQMDPDGRLLIHDIMMGSNEYLIQYAPKVVAQTANMFPGYEIHDFGDHAGHQVKDTAEKTAIQLLETEHGIVVSTRPAHVSKGLERIQKMLSMVIKKAPGIVIHPRCEAIITGFEGGYCRLRATDGNSMDINPYKDGFYEHQFDAIRYIVDGLGRNSNVDERLDRMSIGEPGWSYNPSEA
jgi:PBSX family phage terminase large subunit